MMVQMLMLTNDLNDRDEQINVLRGREAGLQQQYSQKEKMWEQDALVRMQLGKKLEQILMDKEDLQEENEMLHVRMRGLALSYITVYNLNVCGYL
jgi:hypothetical protein